MDASSNLHGQSAPRDLVLTRVFGAPRRLVWAAWTEREHLAQWWGPNGFTNPVCDVDVRPGGAIRIDMHGPDGTVYPMTGIFREVVEPKRLVFSCTPIDEKGQPIFEVVNTVTFAEQDGRTTVTMHAHVTTETLAAAPYLEGMEPGWSQSLDRLGKKLAAMQGGSAEGAAPGTAGITRTADREIVISREFEAPRELVWEAWTNPEHVVHWWGPRGFTTTIEKMEVRPGGVWKHVMHGPDGTDYPNKSVFTEVVKPERITYSHGGGRKGARGVHFEATWTFEALDRGTTRLTIRQVFPTAEDRDRIVKDYGAIEGGKQTLERLSEHLRAVAGSAPAAESGRDLVITRVFDAPRELVFKAWTEPERLMRWWAPSGCTTPFCTVDLRVGGAFHYCMRMPEGQDIWGIGVYREIVEPERIVFTDAFANAEGNPVPPAHYGMSASHPAETLVTVTFAEHEGRTKLTLRHSILESVEERGGTQQGWTEMFDQLAAYVAKVEDREGQGGLS